MSVFPIIVPDFMIVGKRAKGWETNRCLHDKNEMDPFGNRILLDNQL